MKKILFLFVAITVMFTASSFKPIQVTSLSITKVEKTVDGNKVYFEIVGVIQPNLIPGLLVSATYKNGRYDWGGNPNPYDMVTVGNITTGYFLDEPIQGNRKRWYRLYYWNDDGSVLLSDVFEYSGK